jgi:hypothetical protein
MPHLNFSCSKLKREQHPTANGNAARPTSEARAKNEPAQKCDLAVRSKCTIHDCSRAEAIAGADDGHAPNARKEAFRLRI